MPSQFLIDVTELLSHQIEPRKIEISGTLSDVRLGDKEVEFVGPVIFSGRVENVVTGIVASGVIKARIRLECFRCLEEYEYLMDLELSEMFEFAGQKEVDSEGYFVNDHKIDLEPLIRETVIFGIPIKQLCREDCRGMCPVCGINLNAEQCSCAKPEADERWAKLQDLLTKDSHLD